LIATRSPNQASLPLRREPLPASWAHRGGVHRQNRRGRFADVWQDIAEWPPEQI